MLRAAESKEYKRARQWVSDSLLVEQGGKAGRDISVFECTIRVLGGLLSAYDLTAGTLTTTRPPALEMVDHCALLPRSSPSPNPSLSAFF